MFLISSYLFHPAVMVEYLKLQQDPGYPVEILDDPLGLWCRKDSWMLHNVQQNVCCTNVKAKKAPLI